MGRAACLVVLFCASLLAAAVQPGSASSEAALDRYAARCLHDGTESTGDPRSGSVPAEHAGAILGGRHWAGPGGQGDPMARYLPQTFRGQPAVPRPDVCRSYLSGRPLHLPLLI